MKLTHLYPNMILAISPVQKMPSRQSTREWDALNRLEVGIGKKTYNVVKTVRVVEAGEGEGRCNPILVSHKSIPYEFKSNHVERHGWASTVTWVMAFLLVSNNIVCIKLAVF